MRAGIYARISDDESQEEQGVDRQIQQCRDLATREGIEVHGVPFQDNNISAYAGKPRPQWDAMARAIETRKIDVVIARDVARLSRDFFEHAVFIQLARKHKILVITTQAKFDLTKPGDLFMFQQFGNFAGMESGQKSENILNKFKDLRARGGYSSVEPYGYKKVRVLVDGRTIGSLERKEPEASHLERMVRDVLSGESTHDIAGRLNKEGVPTKKGQGHWQAFLVKRILLSPTLAGYVVHKGEILGKGIWEPLISPEDHERLKVVLSPKNPNRRKPGRPLVNALRGLLVCAECESTLTTRTDYVKGKPVRLYICPKFAPGVECEKRVSVRTDLIEPFIRDELIKHIHGNTFDRLAAQVTESDSKERDLLGELREIEDTEHEIAADFANGKIARSLMLKLEANLQQKRDSIERELARESEVDIGILAKLPRDPDALREVWDKHDAHWQRNLLDIFVEKILIKALSDVDRTCAYDEGCTKQGRQRGLCSAHYMRVQRAAKRNGTWKSKKWTSTFDPRRVEIVLKD